MDLTNKLRALRLRRGITQETLAEAMGVSAQAVSKWERGAAMPDIAVLPELAVYFGVSLDELFGLTEEKEYDRIQNMLWDKRLLTEQEFRQAADWLDGRIAAGSRTADCRRLKADLCNHQSDILREQAAEEARAALEADPACSGALQELNQAMGGYIPDWCVRNHHRLIALYQELVRRQPQNRGAYLWLLDNLIDDGRFDEAEQALQGLASVDNSYRTPLYRGLLLWHRGRREDAHVIWKQMERDNPDDWCCWFSLGDIAAMELRYSDAIACYRRGIALQKAPRYVDGYVSIAQICEILGDTDAAIAAREEELEVLAREWDTTDGETAEAVRREIARLRGRNRSAAN